MGLTGGKGGGKNALAAKPNLLNALRVQTSSYGQVIPILYGQNRLSGRLLWAGDFAAVPHTSTQKTGGKGLGSGGGQVTTQTTYTYQTAVAIAVCMGPVQSMGSVWDTKGKLTLLSTSQIVTVPTGGGGIVITPPGGGVFHTPRGVSRSDSYSFLQNDFGSDGSLLFTGNQNTPMASAPGAPGAGQFTTITSASPTTISNATNATPIVIADTGHGFITGQLVSITGVNGNTAANNTWTVTVVDANHFSLNGSAGNGAYTSGGSAISLVPQFVFANADAGKSVTINYAYSVPDTTSTTGVPLTKLSLTLFPGSRPQGPWSYLTSAHPTQALGYNGIAYLNSTAMDLGTSGSLPNLSYEIIGLLPFGGGITDAEPSSIINDLITSPFYGMSGTLALDPNTLATNASSYRNYCIANGLFLSPVLDAQKTAADWIKSLLDVTNAAAVWSEGVLKIISYGDTTVVGNGATFIPNTTPIYDLTTTDLLSEVLVKRPSVADVMNSVSVEYVNRANDYNVDVAEDKDEAAIGLYGLRKAQPVQAHAITSVGVAQYAANLIRKRMIEIRAAYTFTLGWQFDLLEPMDLVTITVPELGYKKKPVRITAIREDDSGQLEIDCEDFPWGTATATAYGQQVPTAFAPNTNADPGNVNTPVIFEAPFNLSRSGNHEVWVAVSGSSPNWGGCHIWASQDGVDFRQIGTVTAPARMGVVGGTGVMGIGDPFTGPVTITFDLTQSNGVLLPGTQADADSYRTLMYVGGEFLSYSPLQLVSTNLYLPANSGGGSTYIRRGLLGSTQFLHSPGQSVVRVDDAVFSWAYDPAFIGKVIFFKFTSINTAGVVEQSLATAAEYVFLISGKYCQMESVGKNLVANPSFEYNQSAIPIGTVVAGGNRLADGWRSSVFGGAQFSRQLETFAPHAGTVNALIRLSTGQSIAAATTVSSSIETDMVPIAPGDSYAFGGWVRVDANAAFPANVGCSIYVGLNIYSADGSLQAQITPGSGFATFSGVLNVTASTATKPYQKCDGYITIAPTYSGIVPAMMSVVFVSSVTNSSGTAFSTGSSLFCDARADDIYCVPQWAMTGNEIGSNGNRSVTYAGTMSYANTGNSITWTWTSLSALRTDLAMSSNSYTGSQAVTGLAASTSYNFYPFIDEVFSQVSMVATGGTGTPSWAHIGTNAAWTQEMTRADHFPLSNVPFAASTVAAGGTGGGGSTPPPDGACLRHDVKVRERSKGLIAVSQLEIGDWVSCPVSDDTSDGWVEITDILKGYTSSQWVHSHFNNHDWLATTTRHPFTLMDGSERDAFGLTFEDQVPCLTGVVFMNKHSIEDYVDLKVDITVNSKAHVFYAGMVDATICQHNVNRISIS